MPPINEEEKNAMETATVEEAKPETGADTSATVQATPQTDDQPADTSDSVADELAKWKAMARKNEKQSTANFKQMQAYEVELAKVKADNARLTVSNKYPQVTAEVLADLCSETDPEKIEAWAERYAQRNPISETPKPVSDPLARKVTDLAENPQGAFNPKPKRGDAYQRSQARQNARRRNKQTK